MGEREVEATVGNAAGGHLRLWFDTHAKGGGDSGHIKEGLDKTRPLE
jgi:hypothetical protein